MIPSWARTRTVMVLPPTANAMAPDAAAPEVTCTLFTRMVAWDSPAVGVTVSEVTLFGTVKLYAVTEALNGGASVPVDRARPDKLALFEVIMYWAWLDAEGAMPGFECLGGDRGRSHGQVNGGRVRGGRPVGRRTAQRVADSGSCGRAVKGHGLPEVVGPGAWRERRCRSLAVYDRDRDSRMRGIGHPSMGCYGPDGHATC